MTPRKLKTILLLIAVSCMLCWNIYHQAKNRKQVTDGELLSEENLHAQNSSTALKTWPVLPSYLPWSGGQEVPFQSCEAYFGNGFTERIDVLEDPTKLPKKLGSTEAKGWFRCYYSESLQSLICEGGSFRMDPDKILMSEGGERLKSVIGRSEEEELPVFQEGAFVVEGANINSNGRKLVTEEFLRSYLQDSHVDRKYMRDMVGSIQVVGADEFDCSEWVEEPTLFITRFEYANLFHTLTDWYSAYVASRVTGVPGRPHVVFVDGHCEAPNMDDTWNALFSSVRYAKSFSSPVCFRHAILAPSGSETALILGLPGIINCEGTTSNELLQQPSNERTARLSEFGEMIRAAFDLPVDGLSISRNSSSHTILFIRREDYKAHPRQDGSLQPRLSNEQEVFDSLQIWASHYSDCNLNFVNGLFAHMQMIDQVQTILDASIIIGAHGADLTHIMWALPNTVVVEIRSKNDAEHLHFSLIAKWKGLEHQSIYLSGTDADPQVVIERIDAIVESLQCHV